MKKNSFLFIFAIVLFSACKKSDSTSSGPDCSVSTANIAGSYKVTAISYKAPGFPTAVDGMPLLQDCQKDDIYVLNANGVANYNDVGTVCSPSGTSVGTWSLSGDQITISTTNAQTFTIVSFDCLRLVGKGTNLFATGDEATVTFTKQ